MRVRMLKPEAVQLEEGGPFVMCEYGKEYEVPDHIGEQWVNVVGIAEEVKARKAKKESEE